MNEEVVETFRMTRMRILWYRDCTLAMKFLIWIIILLVLVAAFIWWRSSKAINIQTFWDAVRNPGSLPDLNEFHKHVSDSAEQLRGSPEKIAALVDYFVFEVTSSREADTEKRILWKLGTEAYPQALAILKDPTLFQKIQTEGKPDSDFSSPEAPINRLCEIFDGDTPPPPEAAELVVPFVSSNLNEIRKSVGLLLGSIGSPNSLQYIKSLLGDSDSYVRSYVLMGIKRAVTGKRINDTSRPLFYELVSSIWPNDTDFNVSRHVASLMLELDRDAAVQQLLRAPLFTTAFKPLGDILEAFERKNMQVPREKLLLLITELKGGPMEYSRTKMLRASLSLLGAHRMSEDLPMLEQFLDSPDEAVTEGAVKGLYQFHRFSETIRDAWEVENGKGWQALTKAEKHILAVEILNNEVNNGGFTQYYFNSSGDQWVDTLAGLDAIGAAKHKDLMLRTLSFFPDKTPSTSRNDRSEQLAKIVRRKEDPFHDEDSAWYKLKEENLDKLMLRYNLANLEGRQK